MVTKSLQDDGACGDQPPPYSLAPISSSHPSALKPHLQDHLTGLSSRMRKNEQERQEERDMATLRQITPLVESFLTELSGRYNAPPLATLVFVPKAAVGHNSVMSGLDEMRQRGELGRVHRVANPFRNSAKGDSMPQTESIGERYWLPGREFTDWGRWDSGTSGSSHDNSEDMLWWRDEEMARRLTSYLQPPPQKQKPGGPLQKPTAVQAVVERSIPAEKGKRGWAWGKRRSEVSSDASSTLTVASNTDSGTRGTVAGVDVAGIHQSLFKGADGAKMDITAKWIAFRQENEFGILESTSGWGIVVAVKV